MIVVANTAPIISLAAIGCLDLFERLFGKLSNADAVYKDEMIDKGRWYSTAVRRAFLDQAGES